MVAFNLKSTALHQYNEDDDETEPSITNEFATAAFRFGHSLIQGLVKYIIHLCLTFDLNFLHFCFNKTNLDYLVPTASWIAIVAFH